MDVIIFSGQSNMQGQSESLSENDVVENAYEYKFLNDTLTPLKNPVGENITYAMKKGYDVTPKTHIPSWLNDHALGASCYGNTNLVPAFCRTYTQMTKRQVLAVHAAKGSTKIADWLPGTPIYRVLIQKACAAIKKVKPERIFFVWLQGESDAIEGVKKEDYKASLRKLQAALKAEVGIERFGIIRVGRFTGDDRDTEIILAQDEICRESLDFIMLTDIATDLNEQSEYMNPYVAGHYSAKGLELLGSTAARALCVPDRLIARAISYVKEKFENEYSGHDYFHTLRVFKMASKIASCEGANMEMVQLAALLHDVDDRKISPQTYQNQDNARDFLTSCRLDEETVECICQMIREVSFGQSHLQPKTLEGKCVQDADRLDAIGAVGIARAFAYGGHHQRLMHHPDIPPNLNMTKEEYRKSESTTVNHFYEKLFRLTALMNTPTAISIAQKREAYMKEFISEFMDEWDGIC